MTPFDIVKNIQSKDRVLTDQEISDYFNSFMVNRIFSNDQSIVHLANELNKSGFTSKMVYDCYFYGLPKMKKYIPYNSKREKADKEIQYIMDFYKCNLTTAKQYASLISDEEKTMIVEYNEKRGSKS